MSKVSDEMISAWLDGELAPDEHDAVERAMAQDAGLVLRAARLARGERLLEAAYRPTLDAEIPPRFDAILSRRGRKAGASVSPGWLGRLFVPATMATAAASLVVGLIAGSLLLGQARGDATFIASLDEGIVIDRAFSKGLSTHPSGRRDQGGLLHIRLTLKDAAGRYCREFAMPSAVGVACRDDGVWKLEALDAASNALESNGQFVMAGDERNPVVEAALARIGVADVLDGSREAAAIAREWKTDPSEPVAQDN